MLALIQTQSWSTQGAGRVAFSNQQSYIAAISARFVQLQHNDIDKRVSKIAWSRMVVTKLYRYLKNHY